MKKNLPFGLMFHHFYDDIHPKGQGALSLDDLNFAIKSLSTNYHINTPDEFIYKYENCTLRDNDTCLTFDDGLKCQYDIALPLLEDLNLKAFFFIYSKPFFGTPVSLESHRFFRSIAFNNIETFYKEFFFFLKLRYQIDMSRIGITKFKLTITATQFSFITFLENSSGLKLMLQSEHRWYFSFKF